MNVLVTGGTGFVGGHVVERLRQDGHVVTVLARSPAKARPLADAGIRIAIGDLEDDDALRTAAAGQDAVIQVAGAIKALGEAGFYRVNRDGTRRMLSAAASAGTPRFVLLSSLAAGGPSAPGRPQTGLEPPRPVSAYGRSKLAAERVVRDGALPWTILRPPLVYGPADTETLKIFRLARRGVAPLFGRGEQQLSAVYAPDLAEAVAVVASADAAVGKVYCPCHPDPFSSRELAAAVGRSIGRSVRPIPLPAGVARVALTLIGSVARLAGRATVLSRDKANEFLQPAWTGDPAPLTRDTGWQARHDLPTGLGVTAAWYRARGWI